MKRQQVLLRACLVLGLVGMIAGCSYVPIQEKEIQGSTTQYNKALEKAQNEMLLLNIVRAINRHPMYFTALNDVKGSMVYTLGTGPITAPFAKFNTTPGVGPTSYFSVAPSALYTNNPVFDVYVLNSKDFVNGILATVSEETFHYYWEQHWPLGMLLYLLVDSIKVDGGNTYTNYPSNREKFEAFRHKVSEMEMAANAGECELAELKTDEEDIGPKIDARQAEDLKKLVEVQKAGLELTKVDGKYQLNSGKKHYSLKCGPEGAKQAYFLSKPHDNDKAIVMHLRSPEAILYYLGQLARAQQQNLIPLVTVTTEAKPCPEEEVLFNVQKAPLDAKNAFVTVDYNHTRYVIPRTNSDAICPEDLSMDVLSFISLLLAKQTTTQAPQPTGTVTTIGR